ncbi:hypothetical protein [Streptomyces sp. S.PNR 29]|uniref:hypothetical protein n=1 Tax=Streptomyces sp. S.PNR 29 TaxID=2973805 RepID=UPI0025AF60C9|nr:hypothetical protein [Streptomyces sp. S.PNR 29]MDN0195229.1 hypothetical protein [Streptomyces sp. S.PNR 29]
MIWPVALSGAALRVMRTAAGRRALQLVLLVGGVFALGVLCGEQAHAAERAPSATSVEVASSASALDADGVRVVTTGSAGSAVTAGAAGRLGDTTADPASADVAGTGASKADASEGKAPEADASGADASGTDASGTDASETSASGTDASGADVPTVGKGDEHGTLTGGTRPSPVAPGRVLRPVTDRAIRSVDPGSSDVRVVRPAGDLARSVTEGLAEAVRSLPSLPGSPSAGLPGLPTLPGEPTLPGAPGLPGLPSPPALPSPPGQPLPTPVTPAPHPGSEAAPSADGHASAGRAGAAAAMVAYGPLAGGVPDAPHAHGRRAASSGHAPAHQAPPGYPNGALCNGAAVDNGTPRHGDGHAVTSGHRAPLTLVRGAAVRADAAETRDRYRDIPVFPA